MHGVGFSLRTLFLAIRKLFRSMVSEESTRF